MEHVWGKLGDRTEFPLNDRPVQTVMPQPVFPTPIEPALLTHFLENDRVAVRVFYAEELEPVWCQFRTLSLQTSGWVPGMQALRRSNRCKTQHPWASSQEAASALIRVILSVQHDLGFPKP